MIVFISFPPLSLKIEMGVTVVYATLVFACTHMILKTFVLCEDLVIVRWGSLTRT